MENRSRVFLQAARSSLSHHAQAHLGQSLVPGCSGRFRGKAQLERARISHLGNVDAIPRFPDSESTRNKVKRG